MNATTFANHSHQDTYGIRWSSALSIVALVAAMVVSAFSNPASAAEPRKVAKQEQAAKSRAKFDHLKTGFPLTGAHAQAKCETCHLNGVFKGTPKQCDSCHSPGSRTGATPKPQKHIATTDSCDRCHTTVVWAPVRFNHATVAPGSCATCHNNVMSTGKPSDHIKTVESCDKCHNTSIWTSAGFVHDASTVNNCSNCHGGAGPGIGRSSGHIPLTGTAKQCDGCHRSTSSFSSRVMDHSGLNGQCSTCHNGTIPRVTTYSATHAGGTVNVAQCDTCHKSTTTWATTAKPNHSAYTAATNCAQCHGVSASGPSATKPLHTQFAGTNCFSCHNTTAWSPASKWNHSQVTVAGNCATCHTGTGGFAPADGKVANHVPNSSGSCDACHKAGYATWTGGKFHSNVNVTTGCETCHNAKPAVLGPQATTVGTSALHTGVTTGCEKCHTSPSIPWASAGVNHTGITSGCEKSGCHTGTTNGMVVNTTFLHTKFGTNCFTCHGVKPTAWYPASKWNHASQTPGTGNCSTCHFGTGSGSYPPADGMVSGHIGNPTNANCDTCHKAGYTAWAGGKFHANVSVSTGCINCHNTTGLYGPPTQKPITGAYASIHATVTNCESCHKSTTTWAGAAVDHTTFTAATNCATAGCHVAGGSGTAPTTTFLHTQFGTNCFTCHGMKPTAWYPASKWSHAAQTPGTGKCDTCHTAAGAYPPADGMGNGHIGNPTNANCDTCHKAGYTTWAGGKFHANASVVANCETCHNKPTLNPQPTQKPNTPIHTGVVSGCEKCHTSPSIPWASGGVNHAGITTGCNNSGCHTAGGAGTAPTTTFLHTQFGTNCFTCHGVKPTAWYPASKWSHASSTPGTGKCNTCHLGTGSGAYPPADGMVTNHITSTGSCDVCHRAGYISWAGGLYHANVAVTTGCALCHNSGPKVGVVTTSKPNNATHATVTVCETCHTSASRPWTSAVFTHDSTTVNNCLKCHAGTGGGMVMNPATHIPGTATIQCDQCHKSTALGGFATATMNHAIVAATPCSSCHNGSYTSQGNAGGAQAKSAKHIPYEIYLLAGSSMLCNTCHSGTTVWTTVSKGAALHNGTQGNGVGGWCKGCHLTGLTFSNTVVNISKKTLTHDSATVTVNGVKMVPTDCSMSGCHRPLGNQGTAYSSW